MECGANGFFTKNSPPELLEQAIRGVINNDYYFDMELASVVREAILWQKKVNISNSSTPKVLLSSREIEIILMACKEMSSFEIGDKLCISSRTVEKHRKRIMEKTDSKNFIGVVLFALKNNSIYLDEL
jgi:DNA-binding NarL/FixJ family response regulator